MRIVFVGTSTFAVPSLQKLNESDHEVVLVISQPDRPRGRGKRIQPTPVKMVAEAYGNEIYQPDKIKSVEALSKIKSYQPDLIVVAAYGQIIPESILSFPAYGCINIHASLLPQYRGAAPIQRAIMSDEKETGITIMQMDQGLDTGDILMQKKVAIDDKADAGQLEEKLGILGADMIVDTITALKNNDIVAKKQDENLSSYANMLNKDDEIIEWSNSAREIHNQIRALSPAPGAYTRLDNYKLKIFAGQVVEKQEEGQPGMVVDVQKDCFTVKTGAGLLQINEVQKEGKKRMPSVDFLRGNKLIIGKILN